MNPDQKRKTSVPGMLPKQKEWEKYSVVSSLLPSYWQTLN